MTIYLDMDGVLADFDKGAEAILETDNTYKWEWVHGPKAFWDRINAFPNFFGSLPMMKDAYTLWVSVSNLPHAILTALPRKDATDVAEQKRDWIARNLSPRVEVITCVTHDKVAYCKPGDVLIDDRTVNREGWQKAGGIFIHHTSVERTLLMLRGMGVIG